MPRLTVTVVQAGTEGADIEATLAKAERMIAECGRQDAKVAVFPEAFIGGYPKSADFQICVGMRRPGTRDEFLAFASRAIAVPGPETKQLSATSRDAGLYLTIGVIEREGGTLYCSALFFGPDGVLLGKHRKTVPTAAERLICGQGDGSTLATSTARGLSHDLRNTITDEPDAVLMRGGSMIVGPLGNILAGPCYDGETVLIAEIDTDDITRAHFDLDLNGHYARPDLFRLTVNEERRQSVFTTA